MENVIFKVGNDVYVVYARDICCHEYGYFNAKLYDGTEISISTSTGDLLTYDRNSSVMNKILGEFNTEKTIDEPLLLRIKYMNEPR